MKRILLLIFLSLGAISSFAQESSDSSQVNTINQNESVEVYINKKGKIIVDGKKTTLKKLDEVLAEIKSKNGIVKLAKASLKIQKVQEANTAVSKLIEKHKTAVKIYTDSSFNKLFLY